MEEGMSPEGLFESIKKETGLSGQDPALLSPLTLAFIGDSVFDTVIRTVIVSESETSPDKLNRRKNAIVNAGAQSELLKAIMQELSDEELLVVKRGRNAKPRSMAKNATVAEYHAATGFEALIGYLYLKNETERMLGLIMSGLKQTRPE